MPKTRQPVEAATWTVGDVTPTYSAFPEPGTRNPGTP